MKKVYIVSGKIKIIRKNLEFTQEQVSLLIEIPFKTLRNQEQEVRQPSEWTLDLVVERLLRIKIEEYIKADESKGILSFLTIKEYVNDLVKSFDVEKIYLFGFYIKGTELIIANFITKILIFKGIL